MAERRTITRRRALALTAVAAGAAAAGALRGRRPLPAWEWRGAAMGAPATIVLHAESRAAAAAAIAACRSEIERLELEFSLARPDSALARLNRDGRLPVPSLDMRDLLATSLRLAEASGGAFDPTVQALWSAYAAHFAADPLSSAGPGRADVERAVARTGWRRVSIGADGIAMEPGTALTLNGIAQGYVTERVAAMLRAEGWTHVLVDLGEVRALGVRPDGQGWRVGVRPAPDGSAAVEAVSLADRALAVSAGSATPFDRTGKHHHIIDPRTGGCAGHWAQVVVRAPSATWADGLSTALSVAPVRSVPSLLALAGDATAWLVDRQGRRWRGSSRDERV
ncbi:MAG: FAD:protein FMN transferase, partial [Alphaproteobacteria bacterium]|nr:FAD:protein FMN transferase [Alphaproteobacteria bacterium]